MSDESMTRLDQVDPLPMLRELIQRGDADETMVTLLRLQWLRREQPAATVETKVVPIDGRLVAVRARITTPEGWSVSAHTAVELPDSPALALERADLRALALALDLAGYALTKTPADVGEPRQEDAADVATREPAAREPAARPVTRPTVVDALRKMPARPEPAAAEPAQSTRPQRGDFTVVHDRRPAAPASTERQPAPAAATDDEDEAPLEDYSWTAFWRWAKGHGLNSQAEIAEVIGQPVGRLNPGELRALLREHGVEE